MSSELAPIVKANPKTTYDIYGSKQFPFWLLVILALLPPIILVHQLALAALYLPLIFVVWAPIAFSVFMMVYSKLFAFCSYAPVLPLKDFVVAVDKSISLEGRMNMLDFYEAYFAGKLDLADGVSMVDVLDARYSLFTFNLTWEHGKFFWGQWIPELLSHSRTQDTEQVRDHYDRGNDFYEAFLGPYMIYTSGIVTDQNDRQSLEDLQENKLRLVCDKLKLQPGEKLLDLGCGWGTLLIHAAKNHGVTATGVTLSRNQVEFGTERAKKDKVADKVSMLCMDYRDTPRTKYNKISCLEMAEHVGVRKFGSFLEQVREMLEDDGLFYLQIAGLRRSWQFEDFIWGLFMAKYVFPGADASCPLGWVVNQLECAGFEILSVDTIGIHYSATIERWYQNWMKNKGKITQKYGKAWFRKWEYFLAYSFMIARQGSATCYQIVSHKNSNLFDRAKLISNKRLVA